MIPRMKRLNEEQKKIKIPMLNIVMVFCSVFLLIGATFVNINLKHYILPINLFSKNLTAQDFIYSFSIIPQIPVLMFICSALGKKMATMCVMLYILIGLFFAPIFALGGGITYIGEYSFGYILSYLPAVMVSGTFFNKKYSFLNMILATVCAVLIIHIFGIIYMVLVAIIRQDSGNFISGWIAAQSGLKIFYDVIISFVLVLIGKYVNAFIKYVLK